MVDCPCIPHIQRWLESKVREGGEMAQWVAVLATRLDSPCLIPETHYG